MGCSLTPSSRHHCIQSYSIISSTVTLPPPKYISMAGKQDSTAKAIETNKWNPHSLCPEKHHCWSFHTYSVCVYGCVSDCTFLTLRYLAFPRRISVLTFYNGKSMCKAETLVEWYTMYPSPNHCHQVVILPSCLMPPTSRHPCYFQIPGIILPHSTCISKRHV